MRVSDLIKRNGSRCVVVTADLFAEWIRQGAVIPRVTVECLRGVPEDAQFVAALPSERQGEILFVFESDEWDGYWSDHDPIIVEFQEHYE